MRIAKYDKTSKVLSYWDSKNTMNYKNCYSINQAMEKLKDYANYNTKLEVFNTMRYIKTILI